PPLLMFSILLLAAGRYIKEDIFFIFSISLNVAALSWAVSNMGKGRLAASALLGISFGLLLSSKYIAVAFCLGELVAIVALCRASDPKLQIDARWALLTALFAFAVTNNAIATDARAFIDGVTNELKHATIGTGESGEVSWPIYSPFYLHAINDALSP